MEVKNFFSNSYMEYNNAKVIAFDIFDTILYRKVSPMHVHRMWAERIIEKLKLECSMEYLVEKKFKCARLAKVKNVSQGFDREYSYRQMTNYLRKKLKLELSEIEFYNLAIDIELEVEKQVCYVPEKMKELINDIKKEKVVICISDFYLPSIIMQSLLRSKEINVENIFVSTAYLLQKRTGRLYEKVSELLQISPKQILMIGDNIKSDYNNALQVGMKAVHLNNEKNHTYYEEFEKNLVNAKKEFDDFMNSDEVVKRVVPFSHVSFAMTIFIRRLFNRLKKDNCKHVLFMSREGEFFKTLFDDYQKYFIPEQDWIETHYFYVSRRATIVPSIYNVEKDSFKEIYKNYLQMSIHDFLCNLGMDTNTNVLKSLEHIDINISIPNFSDSKEYSMLLSSEIFIKECLNNSKIQREYLTKYLDDMKIDYQAEGLFLVDVGYSGTSQNNIYKMFRKKVAIHGYYMISYADRKSICENNTKSGILYDIKSGEKKDEFTYNSAVIEMLTLASHCGVDSYSLKDNKIVPVFHDNAQEIECYNTIVKDLQQNIREFFVKINSIIEAAYIHENSYYQLFRTQYKRFIYNPTTVEMEKYIKIPFVDNFAIYRKYEAEKKSGRHKNFSLKGLKNIVFSKGQCLKEQNTHWIAAALYKMDMRCLNPILYMFSGITMFMFDFMAKIAKKRKN